MQNPWTFENYKIILLCVSVILLRVLLGEWIYAISIATFVYIALYLLKLREVHRWLKSGLNPDFVPDAQGVLGSIIKLIVSHKKNIDFNQNNMSLLLNQLHDIISAIPSATIILNKNNEIEWANQSAFLLLGIDGEKDINIRIDNLLRATNFLSYIKNPPATSVEIASPFDDKVTLLIHTVPYANNKKILIAQDITQHYNLRQTRKQFIANASHELRTPLTVISGYLEYVYSDPALPETCLQPLEQAINQANNMEQIISDLLSLSRLDDHNINLTKLSVINVNNHITRLLNTLSESGKSSQHQIKYNHPANSIMTLEIIENELDSVCLNLIYNAIKYTPQGKLIEISWTKLDDKHIAFIVKDEGIGIDKEHLSRVTERFYRVEDSRSRKQGGTGLGLSIVKNIAERYHGKLEINSRIGEGSTFKVIFPVKYNKNY